MGFRQRFKITVSCGVALFAPFLGGSTERWAQGVVLLLLALLVTVDPPRTTGPRGVLSIVLLFLGLAATAFLPASWTGVPGWRQELDRIGVATGTMVSPQPWISAECLVLLLAGAAWICWLTTQQWQPGERKLLAECFVSGAALIAVISLAAFYWQRPVPFWHSERGFGPFPNRNQTGDFFAVSGVLALGCISENYRKNKRTALFFAMVALLVCAALATSYSRAAVILFFAGSAAWVMSLAFLAGSRKTAGISATLLVTLAAAFLLLGGATLERFQGQEKMTLGFRWLIYRDALSLIHSSPWWGIGLGNFEGIFALFRKASAMPSRILHPESDWLWLGAEMGWLAVALVLAALVILLRKVFPLEQGTNRRLRLAAAAAALVFAVHGMVDVPGHRLGSALPGFFAFGLAVGGGPALPGGGRWISSCWRAAAIVFGCVGAVWLCAAWRGEILPGATGVETLARRAQVSNTEQRYAAAVAETTRALTWAPLDWRLYFHRGMAEVCDGNWPRAYDDFRRVNILESTSPLVTFGEGSVWLGSRPSYAIPVWRETLRRCPPEEAIQYYENMLGAAAGMPELRRALHALVEKRLGLEVVYLNHALREEVKATIDALIKRGGPDLRLATDATKIAFFRVWAANDPEELVRQFQKGPSWQGIAWRPVAAYLASQGDLQGACGTAFQFMPRPAFPKVMIPGGMEELNHRLLVHPGDFLAGYAIITTLMEQKNDVVAAKIARDFTSQPGCPRYFYFLEAEIAFRRGDFPGAWSVLQKYEPIGS